MKNHPYAELFPMLGDKDLAELAADIKANGLREPVVTLDGMILDGRNRYAACELAGVKPVLTGYDGNDPLGFVWSRNFHRRHLSDSQRGLLAGKLETMRQGRPSGKGANLHLFDENGDPLPETTVPPPISRDEAAEKTNVSRRTVATAAKVLKEGTPEQIEDVETGKKTLNKVAEEIKAKAKPEREKITRTTKGDPLKDAAGLDVPDNLRDLFGDPWLEEAAQALEDADKVLKRCWNAAKGKGPAYAFLVTSEIMKGIAEARRELESAASLFRNGKPAYLCSKCDATGKVKGKDCDNCRRSGYLPKWRHIELGGKP